MSANERIFLEPNFNVLNSSAIHYRRLMMVYSSIVVFMLYASSGVDYEQSSFLGVQFKDVKVPFIYSVMALGVLYFSVCFWLEARWGIKESVYRLSGLSAVEASFDDKRSKEEYEKQSTLFSRSDYFLNEASEAYKYIMQIRLSGEHTPQQISQFQYVVDKLGVIIDCSETLKESIERFERGFVKEHKTRIRFMLGYEVCVPLAFAAISFLSLVCELSEIYSNFWRA